MLRHVASAVLGWGLVGLHLVPGANAQEAARQAPAGPQADADGGTVRLRLPTITVTAQKELVNVQDSPASVTPVTAETLENAGVRSVSEAAQYAPNTFFTDFTARKLSNARFRGVGSSPNNPGVTTYIDGVPQFNANSSSIELMDVNQIEFVRGPQSALFGRNTLGGVINITSGRPSLKDWKGGVKGPYGNFSAGEVRGTVSGPLIVDKLGLGAGVGYSRRDGLTSNDVTGHDLDGRSAAFGKVQMLWMPAANWEVRGILSGERARDGDYALNDLGALRAKPFRASRDFEGFTRRDIVAPTLLVSHAGKAVEAASITGAVWWKTEDLTDLDYTHQPLVTRDNTEKNRQFTQEFRFASAKNAALRLSHLIALKWQAGVFVFAQNYTQDALNDYSPFVLSPSIPFPVSQHSPQSALDDRGVGVYGQGTLSFSHTIDAIIGVRGDYENKEASVNAFFSPVIAPPTVVNASKGFADVSPQFTLACHVAPRQTLYATAARGFKAGGFNAASPAGSEGYSEEHSWSYEAGAKTSWLGDRLSANAAVFYLNWRDLQVNVQNPVVPAQFYIANAGSATSRGGEIELRARPASGLDLFGGVGYTNARFGNGSVSSGVRVGGKSLPYTPDTTFNLGVQYSLAAVRTATPYVRAEVVRYGGYQYDDANTAGQSAYSLANLRAGARGKRLFAEGWVRNAFDTRYVPTAFAYQGLAPSGFIGESGAPRIYGVRAGLTF